MTLAKVDTEVASGAPRSANELGDDDGPAARATGWLRRRRTDLLVALAYLAVALVALKHLLFDSATEISAGNPRGQAFGEWMLVHGARVVAHFDPPFFSHRMNLPEGVNPLASHGFLGLSIPLAPVTLWLGPARAYAVAVAICLVGTAYAWYYVLSRHLVPGSRAAAVIGGAVGGLGPAMVSHAQGDLSRTALFLVPFLLWRTVRLREPGRALRNGLVLGLLAAWQLLLDEEVLFVVALGWLVFLVAYGIARRDEVRREAPAFLRGLAVAVAGFALVTAYPLWVQFSAPRSHIGATPIADRGSDAFSFFAFAMPSLGTWPVGQLHYALVATEQNTFYGWPLLLLVVGSLWVLRTAVVRALAATAIVLSLLSLGSDILVKGRSTHVPGPWRLVSGLPGFRSVAPATVALAVLPIVVLVLAMTVERGGELVSRIRVARPTAPAAIAWYGMLAAVLVPLAPAPIHTVASPVPAFVSDGTWRSYAPAGSSIMAVPPGMTASPAWRWAASTNLELVFAAGHLGGVLDRAADSGKVQNVSDRERSVARDAIKFGRVAAVVLAPQKNEEALRETTSSLLGFYPRWVDGVWLWDLRT